MLHIFLRIKSQLFNLAYKAPQYPARGNFLTLSSTMLSLAYHAPSTRFSLFFPKHTSHALISVPLHLIVPLPQDSSTSRLTPLFVMTSQMLPYQKELSSFPNPNTASLLIICSFLTLLFKFLFSTCWHLTYYVPSASLIGAAWEVTTLSTESRIMLGSSLHT